MRSRFRQIAHVLLAPVGYLMLAGQSESTNANVNVGSANTWKNYDAMPLEKNGDFDKSGLSMSLCPMMVLKDRHPDMVFNTYMDTKEEGHTMLTAAPKRDERLIQWVLITTSDGADASHVELRAPDETSSSVINDVWRLLKYCEE